LYFVTAEWAGPGRVEAFNLTDLKISTRSTRDGRRAAAQGTDALWIGLQAIDFHVFSRVCCLCNLVAFRFSRRNATRLNGHNLTAREMHDIKAIEGDG
jgi:hypothetical protein